MKKSKHKHKVGTIAKLLQDTHGNVAAVARSLKCSRTTITNRIKDSPALKQVCEEAREGMKDNVESRLYVSALAGESWAVQFYLRTQAKDRGYTEQVNVKQDGPSVVLLGGVDLNKALGTADGHT